MGGVEEDRKYGYVPWLTLWTELYTHTSSKFLCWSLNPLLQLNLEIRYQEEVKVKWDYAVALFKKCEETLEGIHLQARKFLPRTNLAATLNLDFPASGIVIK
jgi:hypothetical protein